MLKDEVAFRTAILADLPQIIFLLADDILGQGRESASAEVAPEYVAAFNEIETDANNEIIVGDKSGEIVAVLQLTYIPNLTLMGTKRALIEGVRTSSAMRGQGLGKRLFDFAFERARQQGCKLAQLTTNKSRPDAIRFYEKLGFVSTHEGMKLPL